MKKIAGIIVLGLGTILLGLNLMQTKMELPSISLTPLNLEQKTSIEESSKNESVKIILPSVFNFMSKLLRAH